MKPKNFFNLFGRSLSDLYKNPIMIVLSVLLGLFLFVISKFGSMLAPSFQTTISNVIWTIVAGLVSLVLASYFFAGLIGVAKKTKEKAKWKDFTSNANRFWFKNFLIILFIVLTSIIIGRIAHYGAFLIGQAFNLSVNIAMLLFVLIYLAGLIGVLIFLTFSSFFLVIDGLTAKEAIKKSTRFVKKNYFGTLLVLIIFSVIYFLVGKIEGLLGDVIVYVFVLPYFVLVMARFVLSVNLKESKR